MRGAELRRTVRGEGTACRVLSSIRTKPYAPADTMNLTRTTPAAAPRAFHPRAPVLRQARRRVARARLVSRRKSALREQMRQGFECGIVLERDVHAFVGFDEDEDF